MSRSPSPSRLKPSTAQAMAMPGKDGHPRGQLHEGLGLVEHPSPGGVRRLGAQPQVAQTGFGQNGDGELDGGLDDQR